MESEPIFSSYSCESRKSIDTISILVVDDDKTCLAIVAAILKKFKYQVVTVAHPNDALCTLRIQGDAFDLVVSDVHMPDMNGFQLQQAIAREFNLPVVLMSADNKAGVVSSGAALFISKPVSPDDFRNLRQIAACKKKRQVISEQTENYFSEETTSHRKSDSDEISISASEMNEGRHVKKNSNRKTCPKNEGSNANTADNSKSASTKKSKVIWTDSLHNKFLEAIRTIGLERAVPKKILEVMNVPGLTRENVASHLQKYRIFLRRVSDASYKINSSDDRKGSSRRSSKSSFASLRTSPSVLRLNRFSKLNYQNPGNTPVAGANSAQDVMLFGGRTGESRLLSSRSGSLLDMIQNDRQSIRHAQNNCQTSPAMEGQKACFDSSIVGSTRINQNNYVGYKISNIEHFPQSGSCVDYQGWNSNTFSIDQLLMPDNTPDGIQLSSAFMEDHQNLSWLANTGNEGQIHESAVYSLLFDLPALDIMATEQPPGQGYLTSNLVDQMNIQRQPQQQQQTQGLTNSSLEFGTFAQFNKSNISPTEPQREDDDFLESLLGTFEEFQTLEGI